MTTHFYTNTDNSARLSWEDCPDIWMSRRLPIDQRFGTPTSLDSRRSDLARRIDLASSGLVRSRWPGTVRGMSPLARAACGVVDLFTGVASCVGCVGCTSLGCLGDGSTDQFLWVAAVEDAGDGPVADRPRFGARLKQRKFNRDEAKSTPT
jgi:hypothetical protein